MTSRGGRWLVRGGLVVAALVALYIALPAIVSTIIVELAAAEGVSVREIHIRPLRWGTLHVDRMALQAADVDATAQDIIVEYSLDSLSRGEAEQMRIAALQATVRTADSETRPVVDVGALVGSVPPLLAQALARVPAASLTAQALRITADTVEFSGTARLAGGKALAAGRLEPAPPLPALSLDVLVDPQGESRLQLRETAATENELILLADLEAGRGTLSGRWSLRVESPNGPVAVEVDGALPYRLTPAGWFADGELRAVMAAQDWRATVVASKAEGTWRQAVAAQPEAAQVSVAAQWSVESAVESTAVAARGSGTLALRSNAVELDLDPGTTLTSAGLTAADWSVGGMRLATAAATRLAVDRQSLGYRLDGAVPASVDLQRLWVGDRKLDVTAEVVLQRLVGDAGRVDVGFAAAIPVLQLTATGLARGNLEDNGFQLELDAVQQVVSPVLARLFPKEEHPYDLDSGRIQARGALQVGGSAVSGTVTVLVEKAAAHYGDIPLRGITGESVLRLQAGGWQAGPGRWAIDFVDVGFPITGIGMNLALDAQRLRVSDLTGQMLGGSMTVDAIDYHVASGTSEFLVHVDGLQLGDVLALEGGTISGSGILDGQVPVQVADDQVRVVDGRFSARPPGGVVRYLGAQSAAAAINQPGVDFAIAGLADFQYQVLDVGVNYQPNGDLLLGVRLQGRNPQVQGGRPIHYNVNVSENVPALLRSLQLTDEFNKRLQRRLSR